MRYLFPLPSPPSFAVVLATFPPTPSPAPAPFPPRFPAAELDPFAPLIAIVLALLVLIISMSNSAAVRPAAGVAPGTPKVGDRVGSSKEEEKLIDPIVTGWMEVVVDVEGRGKGTVSGVGVGWAIVCVVFPPPWKLARLWVVFGTIWEGTVFTAGGNSGVAGGGGRTAGGS